MKKRVIGIPWKEKGLMEKDGRRSVPGIWLAFNLAVGEGSSNVDIYFKWDDSGKILQEGYKPTGGKKRIKRAFLPKKKIRTFEKDDLYLCRESSWKKSREHCSLMRQKCVVFAEVWEGASAEREEWLWFQSNRWLDRIEAGNSPLRLALQRSFYPSNHIDFCALVC